MLSLALRALVLVFVFVVREQFGLELVHRAAGLVDEPAQVTGHLGELAGAEDQQKQQPDDDQFLSADTEHHANITRKFASYKGLVAPPMFDRTYILFRVREFGANPERYVGGN